MSFWPHLLVVVALFTLQPAAAAQSQSQEDLRELTLGERPLAVGSWGADVFSLQRHLRRLGFDIESDGLYGPRTREAVLMFQQRHGLTPTGRVNPETLDALNEALLLEMATMDYTLEPGDSLWSIARDFDTTMNVLVAINELPDRPLRVGEVIKVPALTLYAVKAGDTLSGIAQMFNTSVEAITELNGIAPSDLLQIGTVLKMPREAFRFPE